MGVLCVVVGGVMVNGVGTIKFPDVEVELVEALIVVVAVLRAPK